MTITAILLLGLSCIGSIESSMYLSIREKAYFEGQRDALTGDVKIIRDEEAKCWRWNKSPWSSGTPAVTDISGIPDK